VIGGARGHVVPPRLDSWLSAALSPSALSVSVTQWVREVLSAKVRPLCDGWCLLVVAVADCIVAAGITESPCRPPPLSYLA